MACKPGTTIKFLSLQPSGETITTTPNFQGLGKKSVETVKPTVKPVQNVPISTSSSPPGVEGDPPKLNYAQGSMEITVIIFFIQELLNKQYGLQCLK